MNKNPLAVIKVGGDMLLQQDDRIAFASNVRSLLDAGWTVIVLHGGGPQVNSLQALHGLVPNKIQGRRITSPDDLLVVKQALGGQVNVDLVAACIAKGVNAFGCSGASACLIQAHRRPKMAIEGYGLVDFGEVGDVEAINTSVLKQLLAVGLVPIIASLGISQQGEVFNINADTTVAALAKAMQADLLLLSTAVGGVFKDVNDPKSRLSTLTPSTIEDHIKAGVITDGMVPKLRESVALLDQGVGEVVICNAAQEATFLAIANGDQRVGTRLTKT